MARAAASLGSSGPMHADQVLSPQDFSASLPRRGVRPKSSGGPPLPRQNPSRAPPKVTATFVAASRFEDVSPRPSTLSLPSPKGDDNKLSPLSADGHLDVTPEFTRTRRISVDTFGRRSLDDDDPQCPSRGRSSGEQLKDKERRSSSSFSDESDCESLSPSQASDRERATLTLPPPSPAPPSEKMAAWQALRREAATEWEARLNRSSRHQVSPRSSLPAIALAAVLPETGSKRTRRSPSSPALLIENSNFSFSTAGQDEVKAGSSDVYSAFNKVVRGRRSLPFGSSGSLAHGVPWTNFWRTAGEGHRGSTGGSSRGYTDTGSSPVSRHNSVASNASSSNRLPLGHRKKSGTFLSGILGGARDLVASSSDLNGAIAATPSDDRQLPRRNSKLIKLLGTIESPSHQWKQSMMEAVENKVSPLRSAFPSPAASAFGAVAPATRMPKPERRMSVPLRRGRGGFIVPKGMLFPLGDQPSFPCPTLVESDLKSCKESITPRSSFSSIGSKQNEVGGTPRSISSPIGPASSATALSQQQAVLKPCVDGEDEGKEGGGENEKECLSTNASGTGPWMAKRRSQSCLRNSNFTVEPPASSSIANSDTSPSISRPRSRSETEMRLSADLQGTPHLTAPSALRKVFVPLAQLDPPDEEQHQSAEVSMEEEFNDTEGGDDSDQDEQRNNSEQELPRTELPIVLNDVASPALRLSRSPSREKETTTAMNRTGSSRSARVIVAAGQLLSPTKLLKHLSSKEDLPATGNVQNTTSPDPFHALSPQQQDAHMKRLSKLDAVLGEGGSLAGSVAAAAAGEFAVGTKGIRSSLTSTSMSPASTIVPHNGRPTLSLTGRLTPKVMTEIQTLEQRHSPSGEQPSVQKPARFSPSVREKH